MDGLTLADGDWLGLDEGDELGETEADGDCEGLALGEALGEIEADGLTEELGLTLGLTLGEILGLTLALGLTLGEADGLELGLILALGLTLGEAEGLTLGLIEGETLGDVLDKISEVTSISTLVAPEVLGATPLFLNILTSKSFTVCHVQPVEGVVKIMKFPHVGELVG